MGKVYSLYFDGAIVQTVTMSNLGGSALVEDAKTFPFEELANHLAIHPGKTCVVCSNPQQFFQDIIYLPPAAARHYDKLVRGEVIRAHPELTSFSFTYRIVGDTILGTKSFNKIAVFSYPDFFLAEFITELSRSGMHISAIYAAPYAIHRLALTTCSDDSNQPRIFIASLLGEKFFLVSENGELIFTRKIPSPHETLLTEEANIINMTADYCFQSLRLRPVEAVMVNQPKFSPDLSHLVSVPFRESLPPGLADLPPHITQEYLPPVAAALHFLDTPTDGNILPSHYTRSNTNRKVFARATLITAILALAVSILLVKELVAVSRLKASIGRVKIALSGSAKELADFRKLDAEVEKLKQPIELLNGHNSSLNPSAALAALNLPVSADYQIKGVTLQRSGEQLEVQIEGTLTNSGYSNTQGAYEKLIAQVAQLPGYAAVSGSADILQRTFSILARYDGGGQKSR